MGVVKSTDAGRTWQATGLVWKRDNFQFGHRLAIHQTAPAILLAATTDGLMRTANAGESGDRRLDIATGTDLFAMAAPDSRHLFVTDIGRVHGASRSWMAINVGSGQRVGDIDLPVDVLAADLKDGIVYYLREKKLQSTGRPEVRQRILAALDSVSGRELWERVLTEEQQSLTPPSPRP
jgi:hypothetical protein